MIGFLIGTIYAKQPPLLQLNVQGVGYNLEAPMSTFYTLGEVGETVTILTHMHVREDAMLLFGFATELEKKLFKELIKVNGIGAKMAIGVLSAMSVSEFVQYVDVADVIAITKIPGVGKKTAERLVIEMRDKLKSWTEDYNLQLNQPTGAVINSIQNTDNSLAEQALVSLGYKTAQIEKMLKKAPKDFSLEETIKYALQQV
jgi:Holliday junction DNA helicase RuvA